MERAKYISTLLFDKFELFILELKTYKSILKWTFVHHQTNFDLVNRTKKKR